MIMKNSKIKYLTVREWSEKFAVPIEENIVESLKNDDKTK